LLLMIQDEAGALLFERFSVEVSEPLALLMASLALHPDDDAPVGKGVGETAYLRDKLGAPAGVAVYRAGRRTFAILILV
jgi:hypothetical protein